MKMNKLYQLILSFDDLDLPGIVSNVEGFYGSLTDIEMFLNLLSRIAWKSPVKFHVSLYEFTIELEMPDYTTTYLKFLIKYVSGSCDFVVLCTRSFD